MEMKLNFFIWIIALLLNFSCSEEHHVKIKINTKLGPIFIELYTDKAPVTCKNFLKYIENNKYNNASFYRVVRMNNQPQNDIKIEVIQGGLGYDIEKSPYPPIKHETTKETGILHKNGTLSMARTKPGSAGSEFFICIGDQPELDFGGKRNPDGQGFAAFGKVVEGMDVVKKIQNMPNQDQMLLEPIKIYSIEILN